MLHSIELENFRAFGERVKIPCAPITLIFGQNSAGKSSILHALHVLKQTRDSRNPNHALLPRAEGGIVDLGSFTSLVFDHDTQRKVAFRIEVDCKSEVLSDLSKEDKVLSWEGTFGLDPQTNNIFVDKLDLFVSHLQHHAARFLSDGVENGVSTEWLGKSRLRRPLWNEDLSKMRCDWVTRSADLWKIFYTVYIAQRSAYLKRLLSASQRIRERGEEKGRLGQFGLEASDSDDLVALDEAIRFHSVERSLSVFTDRMARMEEGTVIALENFLPLSLDEPQPLERSLLDAEWSLYVPGLVDLASSTIDDMLDSLFPLGPTRDAPERWYIDAGSSPQDVGYKGGLFPSLLFRDSGLLEQTNTWLEKLAVGYRIEIIPLAEPTHDLFEIRLRDSFRSSNVEVNLPDVGFGVSQILPLVVQSTAYSDRIITVEQPEVHIHPKLQADLGDLLIDSIASPRRNQFIIETHSEHLILRLLRRIRETADGELSEGMKPILPEQISILYVQRGDKGSSVVPIGVTEDGDFDRPWPEGFFAERARELL